MDIVTRTILNYNHKYTGTILTRLCKRSHHKTTFNHVWASNKFRSYLERYKTFSSCHRHESNTNNEMNACQSAKELKINEAVQVRSILENSADYKDTLFPSMEVVASVNFEEIKELCSTDWNDKSVGEILHALKLFAVSYSNGASYEYLLFDSICNSCLVKLPEFENDQIKVLMQCLITLKKRAPVLTVSKMFMEMLNKECLKRFYPASIKQLLLITDAFHQLDEYNSDYIWCVMKKLCAKPKDLSTKEFVQTTYYLYFKEPRKCINMSEMEYYLKEYIYEFSGNEIGIIARAFFLNKKNLSGKNIMSVITGKTIISIQNMDSVSIAYVMKIIRYSIRSICPKRFKALLDNLTSELPRLSLPCLTHITHTFGASHTYNEALTNGILKIVMENLHRTRLKDMERIIFGVCMVTPFTDYYTDICHKFLNEILSTYTTNRKNEVNKIMVYLLVHLIQMIIMYEILILSHINSSYPLSLIRIVMFLTMKNIYVPELLQFVYSRNNLQNVCRIYSKNVTNELLILHCSVEIELPEYKSPLLPHYWYNLLIEKHGSKDDVHRNDNSVPIKTEIVHICKNKLGINVSADYILPYYIARDIIFGIDEQNHSVDVEYILSTMPQGSIKSVNNEESKAIKWHVIIVVPSSLVVNNDYYTGVIQQKLRQLSILGYTPIPIGDVEWKQLSENKKVDFLRKLIYKNVGCSVETKQFPLYKRKCLEM